VNPSAFTSATSPDRTLQEEVLTGLNSNPKTLPTRLLYDATGSQLFERITTLPEYYLTRTELQILRGCLAEVAEFVGPEALVVEPGSGNGDKARLLLGALDRPKTYVPVDVAGEQLSSLKGAFRREHFSLEILPVVADYSKEFVLPVFPEDFPRTLVFFPGSTIGNFAPEEGAAFLMDMGETAGPGALLLLGADLRKDPSVIRPAYDDASGVTAAFNRNVLRHLNRSLGTDFDLHGYHHEAPWIPEKSRIEMRLVSIRDQTVHLPIAPEAASSTDTSSEEGQWMDIEIGADEPIVTEHSYKHSPEALDRLAEESGWAPVREWRDPRGWYSVRLLERGLP
jgi:dimethylhistidine N-methyltransferase